MAAYADFAKARGRVLAALILRETCARFGRARGGFIWALAEPLGGVLLLTFAFSFVVPRPPMGDSFALFYATGVMPFMMYAAVANGAMGAIAANRGLLVYPAVTALDTIIARSALDTLTHVVIAATLFPGFIIGLSLVVSFDAGALLVSLAMAAALGLGIGTLNAVITGHFPTWRQIWSVLNRPLFLISGVLFTPDGVPDSVAAIVGWNPLSHVIAEMRGAFYGREPTLFADKTYVFGLSLALFTAGGLLVRRTESRLIQSA